MAVLKFICSPGCDGCCRYSSLLLEEALEEADMVLGLRLSMHVADTSGTWKAHQRNKDMSRRFPEYISESGGRFFFEARIVDAGMEARVQGTCPHFKRVFKGNFCKKEKMPVYCQARPFEPALPLSLQGSFLHFMKDSMKCPGGVNEKGRPLYNEEGGLLFWSKSADILDEKRKEAFFHIRSEQERLLPVYSALLHIFISEDRRQLEGLCSGVRHDVMLLTSISALIQACVLEKKLTLQQSLSFFEQQLSCMDRQERKFGEKYGDKDSFPSRARVDGQVLEIERKDIFERHTAWRALYGECAGNIRALLEERKDTV